MAMEARLSLRQSQRVVMTPLLQQAIQLLQLSNLELEAFIAECRGLGGVVFDRLDRYLDRVEAAV